MFGCSCICVFVRSCYLVPLSLVSGAVTVVHTWVDDKLRVVGQRVAVNIKHNLCPQQKLTFFFVDWCSQRWNGFHSGCCTGSSGTNHDVGAPGTVLGGSHPGRHCRTGAQGLFCLSFGAWSTLCLAAVWPRSVAKLCERGFLFARIAWLVIRRIRGRSLDMWAAGLVGVGLVAVEILGGGIGVEAQ